MRNDIHQWCVHLCIQKNNLRKNRFFVQFYKIFMRISIRNNVYSNYKYKHQTRTSGPVCEEE